MTALTKPDETLHFSRNMSIEINYRNTQSYTKCRTYDAKSMNQGFVWHQVVVMHKGKTNGMGGKKSILDAIFEMIEGEEFYPIAYRHGARGDTFLVRQCASAFDKLFAQNLRIQLSNGAFVPLKVQLNVGDFKFGQISPTNTLEQAFAYLYDRLEVIAGQEGILNLSRFNSNPELDDIVVNLGNRGVLERVCKIIFRNHEKFRHVHGLILSSNGITTLAPLKVFNGIQFALLDLQDNLLNSPARICRDLKDIKANELILTRNPITSFLTYPVCLQPILNNFKLVDGIPVEMLSKDYTPMSYEVDINCDGYRIDWTNKTELENFQNSTDWHAIMIPDPQQEFSKEEVFDLFVRISLELSEFYPCYYKYSVGEHQFVIRNCYDQLKYFVEVCNLEIKIPHLWPELKIPQLNGSDSNGLDPTTKVENAKTLVYYLRMNISVFKKGQVEPLSCIENAITKRFNAMERLLNLDNFQDAEGLEQVIVNLSCPSILRRVLMQASTKFLGNCIELVLSNNKILTANFPTVFPLMCNLKAIDLGNNWLHNLNDIKELNRPGIKSLRLDGNPLCSKYFSPVEYIRAVKQYFPDLQKLDHVEIPKDYLSTHKNFLCDVEGYNFVEQFITRYFGLYSFTNREELKDMYHPNALFTMTFNFVTTSKGWLNRLSKYESSARNIYKMSDFRRAFTSGVYSGVGAICKLLLQLPKIDFDLLSFVTDTPIFDDKLIVITVHGVFAERRSFVNTDIFVGFTRTFVLTAIERNQGASKRATLYKIVNDQFNLFNPTITQYKNGFKYVKTDDSKKAEQATTQDKELIIIMLQEITTLKTIWCKRCLEDAKWDFPTALEVFMKLCQNNEIPDTAFI